MRRRLGTVVLAVCLCGSALHGQPVGAATAGRDPAQWTNRELAAQLVVSGVSMSNLTAAESWVRAGLGGIVLLGTPPADLGARLQRVRRSHALPPSVMSDEEGGFVQRLKSVIYPFASAESMGRNLTIAQTSARSAHYAARMRALGVDVSLAPVADLAIPGYYIERTDRGFSADPARAAAYVEAWQHGMRTVHVTPVVKHWPGHGQASDTHGGAATTPPFATLQQRDLIPFNRAITVGVSVFMVGHLNVPGLTEPRTPASLSPNALRYLRSRIGQSRLIVTDSLSMGAVTTALGLSQADASVRALRAGADVAMVSTNDPMAVVSRIQRALDTGEYARSAAIISARRLLQVKRFSNPPQSAVGTSPTSGAVLTSTTPTLSGAVGDPLGGTLTARFYLRSKGATSWNLAWGVPVNVPAGSRAGYAVPVGKLRAGGAYEWAMRSCNSASYCSAYTPLLRFTVAAAAP